MQSALYSGRLEHRRHLPVAHAFRHRLFMLYLDLEELDEVFAERWLWSTAGPAPAWFRRADHLGDPAQALDESVRELVELRLGRRPSGPIRLLTHLRYFGHCFNPVSFYYCFDAGDTRVDAMVLEVTNTPWQERHCYVLENASPDTPIAHYRFGKDFHVSPFLPMDMHYDWRFPLPGQLLKAGMQAMRGGRRVFDASLVLERRAISGPRLAATLARQPVMTLKVVLLIHYQALRLWLKRVPVHVHPDRSSAGGKGR